jgi:hypothetical protein
MTVGENGLGPVGSRRGAFSVGVGATEVVVVVVVVLVSGAFSSSLAHDAVSTTIAVIAEPPATAARRRPKTDLMLLSLLSRPMPAVSKISPALGTLAERRKSRDTEIELEAYAPLVTAALASLRDE